MTGFNTVGSPQKTASMRYLLFALICLIAFTSVDTFNTQLTGITDEQAIQQGGDIRWQVLTIGLWIVLAAVSFIPGMAVARPVRNGLVWPAVLLGWVVLSPLWGDDPARGVAKSLVFLVSSLAAWRMASVVTAKEMLACTCNRGRSPGNQAGVAA